MPPLYLNELYELYELYSQPPVRSYLSSRHKLYELNELYERNELYPQSLARRYPSTDGRQPAASEMGLLRYCSQPGRRDC